MAERNRIRFNKWLWDNIPPFFFIFFVVLLVFVIVGFLTKAIGPGPDLAAEAVEGAVLVPLIILLAWFFLFTASILISLWKSGHSKPTDQSGQAHASGLRFPGGGAASQW
jgi:hypothetical protein